MKYTDVDQETLPVTVVVSDVNDASDSGRVFVMVHTVDVIVGVVFLVVFEVDIV